MYSHKYVIYSTVNRTTTRKESTKGIQGYGNEVIKNYIL